MLSALIGKATPEVPQSPASDVVVGVRARMDAVFASATVGEYLPPHVVARARDEAIRRELLAYPDIYPMNLEILERGVALSQEFDHRRGCSISRACLMGIMPASRVRRDISEDVRRGIKDL